jgi:protein TonB
MNRTHPLSQFMPYGAPELLIGAPRRLAGSFTAGGALASAAFLLALAIGPTWITTRPITPPVVVLLPGRQLESVRDIDSPSARSVSKKRGSGRGFAAGRVTTPDLGSIVPTDPGDLPDPGSFDLGQMLSTGVTLGEGGAVSGGGGEAPDPVLGMPVPVDELAVVVKEVIPPYPSNMREVGIDGRVLVHMLVGRDGRVAKAVADAQVTVPGLEDAAVEAARRWVFVPAFFQGRPVATWFTVDFVFVLH